MSKPVSRRTFLGASLAAGAGVYGLSLLGRSRGRQWKGFKPNTLKKGVVVARGEDPAAITRAAIDRLGGMARLVSPGDTVLVKPNIAWDRPPHLCANTNPEVVAAVVELCREAGARKVVVLDHTCSTNPEPSYITSGIQHAAARAGADVRFVDPSRFVPLPIEDGYALDSWAFYEDVLTCDVLINMPVAKHHSTSKLTLALKNVFGMAGLDRGKLHQDIHHKIADLNRAVKVDLVVLDAYRRLTDHGPTGGLEGDVDNSPGTARRVVAGTDPVSVDAYASTLFGYRPENVEFIRYASEAGLGRLDLHAVGVEEVTVG